MNCTISRFVPLNPSTIGGEDAIVTTWINWNEQEYQLQQQIDDRERKRAIERESKIKRDEIHKDLEEIKLDIEANEKREDEEIEARRRQREREIKSEEDRKNQELQIKDIQIEIQETKKDKQIKQESLEIETQYLIELKKIKEYEKNEQSKGR